MKHFIKVGKNHSDGKITEDQAKVILSDWKKSLNDFADKGIKFDLIFVDPPYDYDVYEKILEKVSALNLLNDNGLIILEHSNLRFKETYNDLTLYKERKYGSKSINIYKK